ncbi:hypothetical protein [Desulfuromonas soudanensis]|uniref:hypothetical protein n=1 Tax=Desulfuromonas soudanensis TaxID=1603606 RepID=UPI0006AD299A|nr:hypothetical protein [Desulfuromonas soudanensis]
MIVKLKKWAEFLHTFHLVIFKTIAAMFSDKIDEAMLCGMDDIPPIQGGVGSEHRNNFANHLRSIHEKKEILKRESGKIGCMHYPWLTSQNLYI